ETIGPTWIQYHVGFYIYALVFVIFDVETVFLYPWALAYGKLGLFALVEMLLFIAILTVGLVYALRKRVLRWWGRSTRHPVLESTVCRSICVWGFQPRRASSPRTGGCCPTRRSRCAAGSGWRGCSTPSTGRASRRSGRSRSAWPAARSR